MCPGVASAKRESVLGLISTKKFEEEKNDRSFKEIAEESIVIEKL